MFHENFKNRYKIITLTSIMFFGAQFLHADKLKNILSDNKNNLFDYDFKSNTAQSDTLENSWINPVLLQYGRSYSEQFGEKTVETGSFSVGIDQPIFRSGGIYYAIKYAQALRGANEAQITLQKRQMIANATQLLFEMKKLKLEQKKLHFVIKNDTIDIHQKEENYDAGLLDSSFLDQAILKKNQNQNNQLQLEMNLAKLKNNFALLSDKDPDKLRLPKLKLISAERYRGKNLELARDKLRAKEKSYNAKITWAKYLPSISLQGRYTDADNNPLFSSPNSTLKEQYFTYGFTISMPLNITMFSDIEAGKVSALKAKSELIERRDTIDKEYKLVKSKIRIFDKQIKLASKNEALYKRLYRNTKDLAKAGEKTRFDVEVMKNSLQIKKFEKQIYFYEKQIELLGLYAKVRSEL